MCLEEKKTRGLECVGDGECDGMLIGGRSRREWAKVDNLYTLSISSDR